MPDKDDTWFSYLRDLLTGRLYILIGDILSLAIDASVEVKQIKLTLREYDNKMTDNETKLRELNTHLQGLGETLTDVEKSFQDLKDKYEQGGDITDEITMLSETVTGLGATGERLKKLGSAVTVPSTGGTVAEPVDHAVPVVETPVDPFFPAPGTGTGTPVPAEVVPGTPVEDVPNEGTQETPVDDSASTPVTNDAPTNDAPQVEDVKENAEDTNTETNSQETPANVPADNPVFDAEVKEDPIFAPKEEDEPFFPASDPATASNPDTADTTFNDAAEGEANTGEETKPVDQPSNF